MAVTAQIGGVTPNSLTFLITHDGAAGDTLALTNAVMQAGLNVDNLIGGPLLDLLQAVFAPATQALARQRMLGQGGVGGGIGSRLVGLPHCAVTITPRTGTTAWLIDADVDAVLVTNFELNITGTAVAGTAVLSIKFQHTLTN